MVGCECNYQHHIIAHSSQRYNIELERILQMNTYTLISTYKLYMLSASVM